MLVFDIQHLTKVYAGQSQPANDDISLQIEQGEIFGLLGDNGAGKSTLVRQMANLVSSTSGQLLMFGKPVGNAPLLAPLNIGYMPQDRLALNNLTVEEALYFTAHLRGLHQAGAHQECQRLLKLWDIEPLRHKVSRRLSGGQNRLVQLSVAMAGQPPVLILDEPTNDLDPQRRKQVWEVIRSLNQEQGTTVVFITHDAIEAEKVIQRVGILQNGKLVALGRPSDLKTRVDNQLRLELFFSPENPPRLPEGLSYHPLNAGRWLVYIERQKAQSLLNQLDLNQIDDFRLYSATLEDLYIHYANHPSSTASIGPTH